MKRTSIALICLALCSVVVFSGQQRRTYRTPQRQATTAKPLEPKRLPVQQPPVSVQGTEPVRSPIQYLVPEDIRFPESANPTTPRNVTLIGDPREPAMYVTRTLIPKGTKGVPHFHADTRTVVVLSGTYYYGTGDAFDETQLVALPPGSLILEPAGEPHFTWARDGDVLVQTTGIGPTLTRFPEARPEVRSEKQEGRRPISERSGR